MRKIKYICSLLWLLTIAACQQDEGIIEQRMSGFQLSLSDELSVKARKAPGELKPNFKEFMVRIIKQDNGHEIYNDYFQETIIAAPAGTFDLTASYGDNPVLGLDVPYFIGSTTAEIAPGMTEPVEVTIPCKVGNALVSFKFDNNARFEKFFSAYAVKVQNGNYSIKVTHENPDQSVYFPAGSSISLRFEGTLKENGKEVSWDIVSDQIPTVFDAAQHVKLTLTVAPVEEGAILTVEKVEVMKATMTETIPLEWLPTPKLKGFDGNGGSLVKYIETDDAISAAIHYSAAMPLQDMQFTINFEDPNYSSLNGDYLLSAMTDEQKDAFASAGVTLPTIGASTNQCLDFTNLTPKLTTKGSGEQTNNVVILKIKANNRWSADNGQPYFIQTNRPEFSVSVYPRNIWTKEFTVNALSASQVTAGKFDKISSDFSYQYSTDGNNWTDIPSDRRQTGLTPDKTYYVRGVYRNKLVSSNVSLVTYPQIALVNGDMEAWHKTETREGTWPIRQWVPRYYPYASGDSDPWWATNMEKAVIWSTAPIEATTTPNCSYVTDAHGGSKAAEVRTSGHGAGYATTNAGSASVTYPKGFFAGSLFLGTYAWNDGEVKAEGRSYVSRPTALSFWYKYTPYNTDAFKVVMTLKSGETTLATATYIPTPYSTADGSYQHYQLPLIYMEDASVADLKPTTLCISFISTYVETIERDTHFGIGRTINLADFSQNSGKKECHYGSQLKIDDISLVYDK
ncbi:MAG: DUF4493 domain-containing protein [Bacteroidales bacterium]|nr:DUF4493 domain-containing protein [Bacteroidales bacterium]